VIGSALKFKLFMCELKVAMELLDHLRRQFAYDAWANREVLARCLSAE